MTVAIILAFRFYLQLARHNRPLEVLMKHRTLNDEALSYYHKHTAEIEIIRHDRSIEPSTLTFDCNPCCDGEIDFSRLSGSSTV
jgi:hypothetical protein